MRQNGKKKKKEREREISLFFSFFFFFFGRVCFGVPFVSVIQRQIGGSFAIFGKDSTKFLAPCSSCVLVVVVVCFVLLCVFHFSGAEDSR